MTGAAGAALACIYCRNFKMTQFSKISIMNHASVSLRLGVFDLIPIRRSYYFPLFEESLLTIRLITLRLTRQPEYSQSNVKMPGHEMMDAHMKTHAPRTPYGVLHTQFGKDCSLWSLRAQ